MTGSFIIHQPETNIYVTSSWGIQGYMKAWTGVFAHLDWGERGLKLSSSFEEFNAGGDSISPMSSRAHNL